VVIDDAHLLGDDELARLTDRVAAADATVIVATEPLAHRPALRALTTALERENPAVPLSALNPTDVAHAAAERFGATPTSEFMRALMAATAGLPFLLYPALAAAVSPGSEVPATAMADVARFALIERLRQVDEPVLDTLLVSSLSRDLGPDDVAATLRLNADDAQDAVDRA
ncbi:LuxR family transcriptional regulator, partial [Mycolicibacterium elephantis]